MTEGPFTGTKHSLGAFVSASAALQQLVGLVLSSTVIYALAEKVLDFLTDEEWLRTPDERERVRRVKLYAGPKR